MVLAAAAAVRLVSISGRVLGAAGMYGDLLVMAGTGWLYGDVFSRHAGCEVSSCVDLKGPCTQPVLLMNGAVEPSGSQQMHWANAGQVLVGWRSLVGGLAIG
jgi:hypothetical protein